MSVGVVGRWLTKKWEAQFTQEVEGGLTNFKKVLVFSSDCRTTCSVTLECRERVKLASKMSRLHAAAGESPFKPAQPGCGSAGKTVMPHQQNPLHNEPAPINSKRNALLLTWKHSDAHQSGATQRAHTLHWKQLLKFNPQLLKLRAGAMTNMSKL